MTHGKMKVSGRVCRAVSRLAPAAAVLTIALVCCFHCCHACAWTVDVQAVGFSTRAGGTGSGASPQEPLVVCEGATVEAVFSASANDLKQAGECTATAVTWVWRPPGGLSGSSTSWQKTFNTPGDYKMTESLVATAAFAPGQSCSGTLGQQVFSATVYVAVLTGTANTWTQISSPIPFQNQPPAPQPYDFNTDIPGANGTLGIQEKSIGNVFVRSTYEEGTAHDSAACGAGVSDSENVAVGGTITVWGLTVSAPGGGQLVNVSDTVPSQQGRRFQIQLATPIWNVVDFQSAWENRTDTIAGWGPWQIQPPTYVTHGDITVSGSAYIERGACCT